LTGKALFSFGCARFGATAFLLEQRSKMQDVTIMQVSVVGAPGLEPGTR
jgi:hypothetical protein